MPKTVFAMYWTDEDQTVPAPYLENGTVKLWYSRSEARDELNEIPSLKFGFQTFRMPWIKI